MQETGGIIVQRKQRKENEAKKERTTNKKTIMEFKTGKMGLKFLSVLPRSMLCVLVL